MKMEETNGFAEESRVNGQETNGFAEESSTKSQETDGFAEDSGTKSQEPREEDIIYELPEGLTEPAEPDSSENSDTSDTSEKDDNADNDENSDNTSIAEKKLQKMIEDVGAETLLEIIRDNRNAAIRQILNEVEASQNRCLQSGVSVARKCNSIFDLAALA